MIKYVRGSMFDGQFDLLVNPVNCIGVMGKGLALQFRNKYPAYFAHYKKVCDAGLLQPGKLMVTRIDEHTGILSFPTKLDWNNPSRIEYVIAGLEKFVIYAKAHPEIAKVAWPKLGCGCGGLDWNTVRPIMYRYLEPLSAISCIFV